MPTLQGVLHSAPRSLHIKAHSPRASAVLSGEVGWWCGPPWINLGEGDIVYMHVWGHVTMSNPEVFLVLKSARGCIL